MPAFTEYPSTMSFDYLRVHAERLNCKLNFDDNIEKVLRMNEKGSDGVLACLCKVGTPCPCPDVEKDLERDGVCYCGIFRRA